MAASSCVEGEEISHARSCSLRAARCAFRGARNAKDRQADRCHHQDLGHVCLRVGPVAVSRHPADCPADPDGHEYCASLRRSATQSPPSSLVSSSSDRSSPPTTPAQLPDRLSVLLPALGVRRHGAAPLLRVPLADGTLIATPDVPSGEMVPSLLALSDVMAPDGLPPMRRT